MTRAPVILDGNEAAASVAYRLNEVIAIYPITPSSPMGVVIRTQIAAIDAELARRLADSRLALTDSEASS